MRELAWQTDQSGLLRGAPVHDGRLVALAYSPGALRVDVQNLSGETLRFDLSGVQELTITELWNGATVSDIYAWKMGAVREATWEMPDSGWGALFRNRVLAAHAGVVAQRIQARQPEPWLFQVECSYGGLIAAVCATIRVFDLSA
jgi:hypothetical protein